jgi:hypothetical protein
MRNALTAFSLAALLTAPQPGLPQQRELYWGAAGRSATGPAYDGFALSLTADATTVHLGAPIWVTVELRNVSGRTESASFGSRHAGYYFTVINKQTGAITPRDPSAVFGLDSVRGQPPGSGPIVPANVSFYGRFRLDILYPVKTAGSYSVQVTRGLPIVNYKSALMKSNAITITILP